MLFAHDHHCKIQGGRVGPPLQDVIGQAPQSCVPVRLLPLPSGNEMDTYAQDVIELARALDLRNAVHIGHSTGGGEDARYVARAEAGRVAKAVLINAVSPVMVASEANPDGIPLEVFDGFRAALIANRAQYFLDLPSGPFYGFNRPGAKVSQGLIDNWWRQGMVGGAKVHYDCVAALSETDFTEDLTAITVPVLAIHGEDDQIVPIANAAHKAIKLLGNGTLKIINPDLLAFVQA